MVMEAVKFLNEKKGSSAIAIRRYILHKYPGVDPIRLKYYLKKALTKGLDKGFLIRPLNSSAQGATGRFKLVSEKSKQGKAKEVESSDGETAPKPAPKAAKKAAAVKKPRSNASAGKPRSKTPAGKPGSENPEEGKKKPKIAGPEKEHGNKASQAPAKPKGSVDKTTKATKKQSAPKASQAKPASGPKKTTSKAKEAKGSAKPKANEGSKLPPAEKVKVATGAAKEAKTNSAEDSATAKAGRSGTKTKPAVPKTKKPEPKKGGTKGKGKEAAGVPDGD
ncbi:protein B4-like [Tiliqua scincoides]|uniref:protein B4-like n=1 Tax=Tiliqua scincoides TaxID=71010 RepID=UPI0034626B1D